VGCVSFAIDVTLFHPRWHGTGDWPPSWFRLFQGLLAGASGARWVAEDDSAQRDTVFQWLETLAPPVILAPRKHQLSAITTYVPNNDLDAIGNDVLRVAELRVPKREAPVELVGSSTFTYAWRRSGDEALPLLLFDIVNRLHTFGKGVDPAFASVRVIDDDEFDRLCAESDRVVHRPAEPGAQHREQSGLPCPIPGSLKSLQVRYKATTSRFISEAKGLIYFRQPPKALSSYVPYDVEDRVLMFDLASNEPESTSLIPVRPESAISVVTAVRDLLLARLGTAYRTTLDLDRFIAGRGATAQDVDRRLKIIPLPSIGPEHADGAIRRVAVVLPANAPIAEDDVRWALSGQTLVSPESALFGKSWLLDPRLVESRDRGMLRHYGYGKLRDRSNEWESVTPVVLPLVRRRGRLSGSERLVQEREAAQAFRTALRHAGVNTAPTAISIRREPFAARVPSAERFEGGRFEARRLYHVRASFASDLEGLLTIGDGRWLGLGLLRRRPPTSKVGDVQGPTAALENDSADDVVDLVDDGDDDASEE
jgi:CRISPR-associated protein Csb2